MNRQKREEMLRNRNQPDDRRDNPDRSDQESSQREQVKGSAEHEKYRKQRESGQLPIPD